MSNAKQLYWSETGEVACQRHAPHKGSDTWINGRWQAAPSIKQVKSIGCKVCRSKRHG